jgi:hypothetical protein
MLIKIDSDVLVVVVASLCDCLKVCHHKKSEVSYMPNYHINLVKL